ncbi:Hypothetical_protein [Hexamita inflata]|uniref:Hypothetical_protein n=1 Tax=Hexamita inflata TaxID=28002 RepID=A0AA86Q824_9EUKA|nr:Hypothetical protein HINF_LOCUS41571 [Hexamita inflata]
MKTFSSQLNEEKQTAPKNKTALGPMFKKQNVSMLKKQNHLAEQKLEQKVRAEEYQQQQQKLKPVNLTENTTVNQIAFKMMNKQQFKKTAKVLGDYWQMDHDMEEIDTNAMNTDNDRLDQLRRAPKHSLTASMVFDTQTLDQVRNELEGLDIINE